MITTLRPLFDYEDNTTVITLEYLTAQLCCLYRHCRVSVKESPISGIPDESQDEFASWETVIAAGQSYMTGKSMTRQAYLRKYTSRIGPKWQQDAYIWAFQNPGKTLVVEIKDSLRDEIWWIGRRGECVHFLLPHQDHGGEKAWVSRNGKSRVLVNVD